MTFANFFFDKLPLYFWRNDSYKDSNDRGLLERYLQIFGLEVDNNIKPLADNYLDIIDPSTVTAKHLSHLAYSLGNPPDMFQSNPAQYAKLLQHIVTLYKIKGTIESYKLFFSLMGFTVFIIEYPEEVETKFDSGCLLDEGYKFDMGCPTCSEYSLVISQLLSNPNNICQIPTFITLNQTMITLITEVIKFIEPINAELRDLISGGLVCEIISHCYEEDITLEIIDSNAEDNLVIMDDSEIMDNPVVISTVTLNTITCTSQLPIPIQIVGGEFDDSFTNLTDFR